MNKKAKTASIGDFEDLGVGRVEPLTQILGLFKLIGSGKIIAK